MQIVTQTQTAAETRRQAKELYLKRQCSKVIEQLKGADNNERKAVIRIIDSFLQATALDGRTFWQKVRREVEKQIE